jgi:hypothetical protein
MITAVELFRGTMLRHSLIAYRDDGAGENGLPRFDAGDWPAYTPLRLPETVAIQKRLPPGAVALLINPAHSDPDLVLPVDANEMRFINAIDGRRTIGEIIYRVTLSRGSGRARLRAQARSLIERLWWYNQVVFDASPKS